MHNAVIKILFWGVGLMLCTFFTTYASRDTTHIYFRLDNPQLDAPARQKIDSLLYHDIINAGQQLLIIGYADHLGTNKYNDVLSENRAKHVKAYLEQMGIPEKQITYCVGKGEVPRDVELPDGYAADRRVDIVNITGKAKPMPAATPIKKKQADTVAVIESKDAIVFNINTPFVPERVAVGQLFVLNKIFFHTGRQSIVKESLPELENLYRILQQNESLSIRIEGHVCCVPPTTDALDIDTGEIALSVNRARYIYRYLVKKGIEQERLAFVGYGKSKPLSKQEYTEEQQDMNKRVEMRIISK